MIDFSTGAKNAKQPASFQSQDKENTPRLPLVVESNIYASKTGVWGAIRAFLWSPRCV